jgi:hypothetical protein
MGERREEVAVVRPKGSELMWTTWDDHADDGEEAEAEAMVSVPVVVG